MTQYLIFSTLLALLIFLVQIQFNNEKKRGDLLQIEIEKIKSENMLMRIEVSKLDSKICTLSSKIWDETKLTNTIDKSIRAALNSELLGFFRDGTIKPTAKGENQ